jgi:hypothetical protein
MGIPIEPYSAFLTNGLLPPLERGHQRPVSTDKLPFVGEDEPYLRQRLADALGEIELPNDELALALALMRYVSGELVYGFQCGFATGAAVFAASPGVTCAAYAKALVALARVAGIPAREAALHNMPDFTGHTVCELWVQNRWICVDPRYGLLFSSQSSWNPEALLSFDQLICQRIDHWYPLKILNRLGTGRDQKTESGLPELVDPTDLNEHFYTDKLLSTYRNMIVTAYPVTYRATATCFPLLADLRESARCELFALNGQHKTNARILGIGANNGSRSLGYAFMNMLWLYTTGPARVHADFRFSAGAPPLQSLPLAHLRVISRTQPVPEQIQFTLHTTAEQSMALIYAPNEFGVLTKVQVEMA